MDCNHKSLIAAILLMALTCYSQEKLADDVVVITEPNVFTVNGKVVADYASSTAESWRFIYAGSNLVTTPFFVGGVTYSPYTIVQCRTLDIATNEITQLGLIVTEDQATAIEMIVGSKQEAVVYKSLFKRVFKRGKK